MTKPERGTPAAWQPLFVAAQQARLNAVAPFSGFLVGAAFETEGGRIFSGCNIENASYGLTVCAERVALWKALSEGERTFKRLLVIADTNNLTPPCGACRQLIWEFCGDLPIALTNMSGAFELVRSADLLPRPFDSSFLDSK